MNKYSIIAAMITGILASAPALADVNWAGWNNNVVGGNGHADEVKTKQNLDLAQNNINNLDATIANNKTNQDAVNANQAAVNTNQDTVNTTQAATNNAQATWNTGQTNWNAGQTAWNANQITINNAQTVTNQQVRQDINQLFSDVKRLDSRLDKLDNKMKRGFASQSALTGLFQPYTVGTHNVTMALGGYESNTALAVGTGYRFNENVAVKSGISSNTDNFQGVSYNAGLNFEW